MPEIRLRVYHSPTEFRTETYRQSRVAAGREINNDIVVPEKENSRFHCLFECDEQGWRIVDLESTNGTFLNGISIKKAALKNGDVVVVGSTRLHVLECATGVVSAPISIEGYRFVQTLDPRGIIGMEEQPPDSRPPAVVRTFPPEETPYAPYFQKAHALVLTAAEVLQGASDPRAMANAIASRLMPMVEADACIVYLCDPDLQAIERAAIEPVGGAPTVTADIARYACEQKAAIYVEVDEKAPTPATGARAVMCAPMLDGRQVLGAIALVRRDSSWRVGEPDLERLAVGALSAAAALSCARSHDRLERFYLELLEASQPLPAAIGEREQDKAELIVLHSTIRKMRGALAQLSERSASLAVEMKPDQPQHALVAGLAEAARQSNQLAEQLSRLIHQGSDMLGETWPVALLTDLLPALREIAGATMTINERVAGELPAVGVAPRVVRAAITRIVLFCRDRLCAPRLTLTAEMCGLEKPKAVEDYDEIAPGQYVHVAVEAEGDMTAMDELRVLREKESEGLLDLRSPVAGLYWEMRMLRRSTARLIVHRQDESTIVFDLYLPVLK